MYPETISLIIIAAYFALHLYLLFGLKKSISIIPDTSNLKSPVSVIVAARNESVNIVNCINSLKSSLTGDIPVEFILVNDNSSDNTFELMKINTEDDSRFIVINSHVSSSANLKGKANAIDNAVSISNGEIIVSTDADCIVRQNWVSATSKYFKEDTGMVCGFTVIRNDGSLFSIMQNIDWLYLLTLASASSGLNKTMSCLGNNLSYTKKAYRKVGGYETIKFSVTEDLALMRKINASKEFKILFPLDKNCLVSTEPCNNLKELFSQKRRWFRGGIGINLLGYVTGVCLFSVSILFLFGLLFLNIKFFLLFVFIKLISELLLLKNTFKIFELKSLYKYYPLFMIYFSLYGLILPFTFIFQRDIKWKDRKF
ncbi:MAG: glycosyltransferase [Ignavibacteria bacterium]|nr:glycosyltransferase [Ignavibacteria bacterium]